MWGYIRSISQTISTPSWTQPDAQTRNPDFVMFGSTSWANYVIGGMVSNPGVDRQIDGSVVQLGTWPKWPVCVAEVRSSCDSLSACKAVRIVLCEVSPP